MTEEGKSIRVEHTVLRAISPEGKKYYRRVKRSIWSGQPPDKVESNLEKPGSPTYPTDKPPVENVPMGGAIDD